MNRSLTLLTLQGRLAIALFVVCLILEIHAQNIWPSQQHDAQRTSFYNGSAKGSTRPQQYTQIPSNTNTPPGYGKFVSTSYDQGMYQRVFSSDHNINIYQLNGYPNQTLSSNTSYPTDGKDSDNDFYVTVLPPFGGCTDRLVSLLYRMDDNLPGVYLYYVCLDNGQELESGLPYNFTTSPVAVTSSDGTYETVFVGAYDVTIAFTSTLTGTPVLTEIEGGSVALAVDTSFNVYTANATHIQSFDGTSTGGINWVQPIVKDVCFDFGGSCFIILDVGSGSLYLYGIGSKNLYCFGMEDGSLRFSLELADYPINAGALSASQNAEYIIIPERSLIEYIDVADRKSLFQYTLPNDVNLTSNLIADAQNLVYFLDSLGRLYGINQGQLLWQTYLPLESNSNQVVISLSLGPNGTLVPSFQNKLYFLEPATVNVPSNGYYYYPMYYLNGSNFVFDFTGFPTSDPYFTGYECYAKDAEGNSLFSLFNPNMASCFVGNTTEPTLFLTYDIIYNEGAPTTVSSNITTLLGVGTYDITPTEIETNTTVTVTGTGFDVCGLNGLDCLCVFGNYGEITDSNVSPATKLNDSYITCLATPPPSSSSDGDNLPFSLLFPYDPASGENFIATSNPNILFTYKVHQNNNHTIIWISIIAAIVALVLVVVIVGVVFMIRQKRKRSEWQAIKSGNSDHKTYAAF